MAAIFEPVTIGWDGEEYTITPTMRLLNRVEQSVSIAAMAHSLAIGEPRLTHIATAVAIFLQSEGVAVTDEQVYQELVHRGQDAMMQMAGAIITAAFPPGKATSGNDEAPPKTKKRQK